MEHKEFTGTWKEIWMQKGAEEGGKEDVLEYGGWHRTVTPASEIAEKIINILDIRSGDKVLEVGCGAGGLAQYMDCDYTGIDYSPSSVVKLMRFFQKPALCAEAADIPFKDGYFDKCFAYGCFMYFPTKEYVRQAVSEMRRVTKKGLLIGELPMESHEPKHLLFEKKDFEELGFTTINGWAEPYTKIRFSALLL